MQGNGHGWAQGPKRRTTTLPGSVGPLLHQSLHLTSSSFGGVDRIFWWGGPHYWWGGPHFWCSPTLFVELTPCFVGTTGQNGKKSPTKQLGNLKRVLKTSLSQSIIPSKIQHKSTYSWLGLTPSLQAFNARLRRNGVYMAALVQAEVGELGAIANLDPIAIRILDSQSGRTAFAFGFTAIGETLSLVHFWLVSGWGGLGLLYFGLV